MNLKNMKTFLKVAELRNFSQAAEQLGYTQSAVSTQIAKLESELNTILFDRVGHKIYLTENGMHFEQYVQNVLLLTENLYHHVTNTHDLQGIIRLATSDSLCSSFFTPLFIEFQKLHPNVQLHIRTGLTDEMLGWLLQNEIDLIYTLDHCIRRSDLVVLKESPEPAYFYVTSSHPLLKQSVVTLQDLATYPIYLTEQGVSYRQLLDQALAEAGLSLLPAVESGNIQVLRELILNTYGIGFIPAFAVSEDVKTGVLVPLEIEELQVTVWKQLLHHKGKLLTPAMEKFIALIPH